MSPGPKQIAGMPAAVAARTMPIASSALWALSEQLVDQPFEL